MFLVGAWELHLKVIAYIALFLFHVEKMRLAMWKLCLNLNAQGNCCNNLDGKLRG